MRIGNFRVQTYEFGWCKTINHQNNPQILFYFFLSLLSTMQVANYPDYDGRKKREENIHAIYSYIIVNEYAFMMEFVAIFYFSFSGRNAVNQIERSIDDGKIGHFFVRIQIIMKFTDTHTFFNGLRNSRSIWHVCAFKLTSLWLLCSLWQKIPKTKKNRNLN